MTQNKSNQGGKPDNDKKPTHSEDAKQEQFDAEAERQRIEQEVREKAEAELAAEREAIEEMKAAFEYQREQFSREMDAFKQQQEDVEAKLRARPDIERPAGQMVTDLKLTDEERKGLSKDATAAQKRALSLRLRKAKEKSGGKSVLRKFRVTITSKSGTSTVIKHAVDEVEAISHAYRELGIDPINGQHTATRVD